VQVAGGRDVALASTVRARCGRGGRGVHGVLGDGEIADHASAVPRVVPGLPPRAWSVLAVSGSHALVG
jgi:hypothetical protein